MNLLEAAKELMARSIFREIEMVLGLAGVITTITR
jgi:hypothetical protein